MDLFPALIPITAFALGTWQVFRLHWKTELIARFEDRLVKPPLPLPPRIDPEAIKDFDYRKVYTTGRLCHEQEMLIGPRIRDGNDGFLVVTPLERDGGSTILVNRGWIPRSKRGQTDRKEGLPHGRVTVEGLLREPWKKNVFTPANDPASGQFYFPDVRQMAELTGSDAVWIEETMSTPSFHLHLRELLADFHRLQVQTYSEPTTGKRRAFPSADLRQSICVTTILNISSHGEFFVRKAPL